MDSHIYLDSNATTFVEEPVCEAITQALTELHGNPSSVHSLGQRSRMALVKARRKIGEVLGVKPSTLTFTSGGTEGINLLMRGLVAPGEQLITSDLEHSAVYNTAKHLQEQGRELTMLHPGMVGKVSPEALEAAIQPNTKLILLTAVNTETGVKSDLEGLARVAAAHDIPFVVDGVGMLGKEPLTLYPGISAMVFSGHKIHAPKGVGVIYTDPFLKLEPITAGGGQESGRRPGTEPLPLIVGLAKAFERIPECLPEATERMKRLRDHFETRLAEAISDLTVNGGDQERICNTSNLAFGGVDGESLLLNLDLEGVAASAGSACTSGSTEPSRVLLNMDLGRERAAASIRFSLSRHTTQEEIDKAIKIITTVVSRLRAMAEH